MWANKSQKNTKITDTLIELIPQLMSLVLLTATGSPIMESPVQRNYRFAISEK